MSDDWGETQPSWSHRWRSASLPARSPWTTRTSNRHPAMLGEVRPIVQLGGCPVVEALPTTDACESPSVVLGDAHVGYARLEAVASQQCWKSLTA